MAPDHHIPNAMKRSEVHRKDKKEKAQAKLKKRMEQRKLERDPANGSALRAARLSTNVPRTLDNTREYDSSSYLTADPTSATSLEARKRIQALQKRKAAAAVKVEEDDRMSEDDEDSEDERGESGVAGPSRSNGKAKATNLIPTGAAPTEDDEEEDQDAAAQGEADEEQEEEHEQPASYSAPPRILLTTSPRATLATHTFVRELANVFPGGEIRRRPKGRGFELGRIARWAAKEERGYDCVVVVNEDHKTPNAITVINLPAGPTAYFKLTSVQLGKEIYGHARPSPHSPELILNNFHTLLGLSIGRLFGSLFPPQPQFRGRQVVTLHNQRDFLFFRRHRYMFKSPTSAKLQEIGPRFTLKLRWLRKGLPAVGAADGVAPTNAGESDEEVDDEADDGEIGDEAMNDEMEVDPRDDGEGDVDEAEQKEKNKGKKGVGKAKGGQTIPALDEQQEYEWKWKPKMEVSRRTFFL